jgi:membrane associated rhomboid family serine protease
MASSYAELFAYLCRSSFFQFSRTLSIRGASRTSIGYCAIFDALFLPIAIVSDVFQAALGPSAKFAGISNVTLGVFGYLLAIKLLDRASDNDSFKLTVIVLVTFGLAGDLLKTLEIAGPWMAGPKTALWLHVIGILSGALFATWSFAPVRARVPELPL